MAGSTESDDDGTDDGTINGQQTEKLQTIAQLARQVEIKILQYSYFSKYITMITWIKFHNYLT